MTMQKNHVGLALLTLLLGIGFWTPGGDAVAAPVLIDNFNNGDLATGGPGTVQAGFQLVTNNVNGAPTVTESGGLAQVPSLGGNNNSGIVNINPFDVSGFGELGFTAFWDINSSASNGNRTELLLQGGTGFRDTPNIRLQINHSGSVDLISSGGSSPIGTFTSSTLEDGFTVLSRFDDDGWEFDFEGLSGIGTVSGNWGDNSTPASFAATFAGVTHISAMQQNGAIDLTIDNIFVQSISAVPEPGSASLIGLSLAVVVLRSRRSRQRDGCGTSY